MITLTRSERAAADAEFQRLLSEFRSERQAAGDAANPHHYFTVRALWHRTHGASAVEIVDDINHPEGKETSSSS